VNEGEKMTTVIQSRSGRYLTFKIANEEYGVEILNVQEIIGIIDITRIPKSPLFMRGIINLRGKVIPVIDLRLKFGLESIRNTEKTCIIVVHNFANDLNLTTGIIVDEVFEVFDIQEEEIEDTISYGAKIDTTFVLGMGIIQEKVVALLDIERILTEDDISFVECITQ
jgi:purine-binding chemotaxis protein CheW